MRKPFSEETKRKISRALMGRKASPELRKKLSLAQIGRKHKPDCAHCLKITLFPVRYWLGKKMSLEHRKRIGEKSKGRRMSEENKRKLSERLRNLKEKHPWWKGGLTPEYRRIRASLEYTLWRSAVWKRDNFTCVLCGDRSGKINADHIKSFRDFPELRFEVSNGRTLCIPCHRKTDNYGSKSYKERKES